MAKDGTDVMEIGDGIAWGEFRSKHPAGNEAVTRIRGRPLRRKIVVNLNRESAMCSRQQLLVRLFAFLAAMFILVGCSSLPRTAYIASDAASSTVLDLSELRR